MFFCILSLFVLLLHTSICAGVGITGGKEAIPHSRRYMALVRTGPSLCGGTLIKDNWVLTAAACKVDKTTTVDLGVHSIKTMNKLRQQFKVVRWVPHQKFDRRSFVNNLQLLQLSGKANFSYAVNVLPLPSKYKDIKPGTVCQTAGWGITAYNGKQQSDKLMEVSLTVLDRMKCNDQWKLKIKVSKDMMCTSDKGKRGFCNFGKGFLSKLSLQKFKLEIYSSKLQGDSGGPLICNRIFTGVISFGPLICGMENGANVYTRLTSDHIKWIKKVI